LAAVYFSVTSTRPFCLDPFRARPCGPSARLLTLVYALLLLAAAASPHRLSAQLTAFKVLDASALVPPLGARVAIVEFDDLECPTCAHYNPVLKQAAANYKIPWVRHDFLIPYHTWSRAAAVDARWFDAKSKALGDEYRDQVFANQSDIDNQGVLNQFTQKFAQSHGISLPFSLDPQGKLAGEVQADNDLGLRTGIHGTPSIFIVSSGPKGPSYTQVLDPDRDLYRMIDAALAATRK
jgi:protein-disulfide isomerase